MNKPHKHAELIKAWASEWILCSERLPDPQDDVLIFTKTEAIDV